MAERQADEGEELAAWSRSLAVSLFNATWELIDRADRTDDEDVEMLLSATASRWHWGQVGTAEQVAIGDWQVGHVASLLGLGELALRFAERHLAAALSQGWAGWRLASAHEGVSRAYAILGDDVASASHRGDAEAALALEPDEENRAVIESQLATIPRR